MKVVFFQMLGMAICNVVENECGRHDATKHERENNNDNDNDNETATMNRK
jgi:hypothetical protein